MAKTTRELISIPAPPSPSPTPREDDRTNARRSIINPRTTATPAISLDRVRTGSNVQDGLDNPFSRSRAHTRSDALTYPSETSSSRARSRSNPGLGYYDPETPPPLPRNRTKSKHSLSFADHEPYPQPSLSTSGILGTKTLEASNWLTLDQQYSKYHKVRGQILDTRPNESVQTLPSSKKACNELVHVVVKYLLDKYPDQFCLRKMDEDTWAIHNLTTEEYFYTDPLDTRYSPLAVCARLTQDDFSILLPDSKTGEHKLFVSNLLHTTPHPNLLLTMTIV